MAQHKLNDCIDRDVLCRFCGNYIKAGAPCRDHGDRLRGFTQHESDCGGKTAACSMCSAKVRVKDMEFHVKLHQTRAQPIPDGKYAPCISEYAVTLYRPQDDIATSLKTRAI